MYGRAGVVKLTDMQDLNFCFIRQYGFTSYPLYLLIFL
ncbi:MAG: hypothetical protein AVDCRST_MAG95-1686 [uncultured Adhaeribacter sp.]|uniref:Uncharacterized protein n=1 Tax=uncultured Adhaeribacter sp. TaxID=448109 RepID=A0A6J4IAT6_9BACT|nr:MAG: hypothetical protein AVDCRST_MAG95-1686 [uncultured Adhaeribacter sp.]